MTIRYEDDQSRQHKLHAKFEDESDLVTIVVKTSWFSMSIFQTET